AKWPGLMARMTLLPDEIEAASANLVAVDTDLRGLIAKVKAVQNVGSNGENGHSIARETLDKLDAEFTTQMLLVNGTYNYERPKEWRQDFGWDGALAQLDSAMEKIKTGMKNYD